MSNTPVQTFRKDPDATLDYGLNFDPDTDPWLESGETLSDADWTVPSGLTKEQETLSNTTSIVWLSGGTAGASYTVACKVTTSDGRIDERSFIIQMTER